MNNIRMTIIKQRNNFRKFSRTSTHKQHTTQIKRTRNRNYLINNFTSTKKPSNPIISVPGVHIFSVKQMTIYKLVYEVFPLVYKQRKQ